MAKTERTHEFNGNVFSQYSKQLQAVHILQAFLEQRNNETCLIYESNNCHSLVVPGSRVQNKIKHEI